MSFLSTLRRNVFVSFVIVFLPLVAALLLFLFLSLEYPSLKWKYGILSLLVAAVVEIPYLKLYLRLTKRKS